MRYLHNNQLIFLLFLAEGKRRTVLEGREGVERERRGGAEGKGGSK